MKTALDELKEQLVIEWDEADAVTKEKVIADHDAIPSYLKVGYEASKKAMNEFYEKYTNAERELMSKSSDEIHEANVKQAGKTVDNLVKRVEKKIGTITDYTGVYTDLDNEGFVILNGWFTGEKGSCEVRSIRAGGYNIQKRHIRVLVK